MQYTLTVYTCAAGASTRETVITLEASDRQAAKDIARRHAAEGWGVPVEATAVMDVTFHNIKNARNPRRTLVRGDNGALTWTRR